MQVKGILRERNLLARCRACQMPAPRMSVRARRLGATECTWLAEHTGMVEVWTNSGEIFRSFMEFC